MTKLMSAFLTGLLAIGLTACSFGSGSNDQTREYQEQKETLIRDFEAVTGTYTGIVQAYKLIDRENGKYSTLSIPLELGLYIEYVADGKDNDGRVNFRPVLKLRYRQLDTVRADVIMDARYVSMTGDLDSASTASQPNMGTTVRARVHDNQISGEIVRNGGTLGKFLVTLKSKTVVSAYGDNDLYQRYVELYKSISGTYLGSVSSKAMTPFPVQIDLSFTPQVSESGSMVARLKASYKRLDFADPSMTERLLNVSYMLDTDPAELAMSADGGTTQIPNAYFMSLNGYLQGDTYTAEFYDRRGYIGTLKVVKQK